jgi:hypothetical protein
MKKAAMGCVLLLVLLVGAAATAAYTIYYKVSSTVSGFAELGTLPQLDRAVRNQRPYVPPASGELTREQLQRFLRVQQTVRARLGKGADELERRYHELLEKDSATIADAPELLSAYRDLAAIFVDAKRTQVNALNHAGFSLDEYRWVRTQVYAALGVPMMELDVSRIIAEVQNGRTPEPPMAGVQLGPSGPPKTRKLVEPYRKPLEDYAPLAFFGL